MEMRTDSYCLAMTSLADTDRGFERLITAMREIDGRVDRELAAEPGREEFAAEHEKHTTEPEQNAAYSRSKEFAAEDEKYATEPEQKTTAAAEPELETSAEPFAQNETILKVPVVREPAGPQSSMKLSDALDSAYETVGLADAAGRVCADFVILYPPDVPLIVPGEMYTEEKIAEIRMWTEKGFSVIGVDMSQSGACPGIHKKLSSLISQIRKNMLT